MAFKARGHRYRELLGQRDELGAGARCGDAAAGHDHRFFRRAQQRQRSVNRILVGRRAEGRQRRKLLFDHHFELRFDINDPTPVNALQVDVRR